MTKTKELKPIETIVECPKCKTKMNVKNIKQAIKHRIDLELDDILDRL